MNQDWDSLIVKLKSTKNRPDGITHKEWGRVVKGLHSLNERKEKDPYLLKQQVEETRSTLAKRFVTWYFVFLLIVLVYVPIYNIVMRHLVPVDTGVLLNIKDVFVMAAGSVGSLLGFVLGFYFKGQE